MVITEVASYKISHWVGASLAKRWEYPAIELKSKPAQPKHLFTSKFPQFSVLTFGLDKKFRLITHIPPLQLKLGISLGCEMWFFLGHSFQKLKQECFSSNFPQICFLISQVGKCTSFLLVIKQNRQNLTTR